MTDDIVITRSEHGGISNFAIRRGDLFDDHMTSDETLWVVACWIMRSKIPYLRTQEQWDAFKEHMKQTVKSVGGITQ